VKPHVLVYVAYSNVHPHECSLTPHTQLCPYRHTLHIVGPVTHIVLRVEQGTRATWPLRAWAVEEGATGGVENIRMHPRAKLSTQAALVVTVANAGAGLKRTHTVHTAVVASFNYCSALIAATLASIDDADNGANHCGNCRDTCKIGIPTRSLFRAKFSIAPHLCQEHGHLHSYTINTADLSWGMYRAGIMDPTGCL
jgi:hypothetical protein